MTGTEFLLLCFCVNRNLEIFSVLSDQIEIGLFICYESACEVHLKLWECI